MLHLPSKVTNPDLASKSRLRKVADRGATLKDWIITFFQQIFVSVSREEWQVGRASFFLTHRLHSDFDFHSYLVECFEEDVSVLTTVSIGMWAFILIIVVLSGPLGWLMPILQFSSVAILFISNTKAKMVIHEAVGDGTVRRLTSNWFWFQRPQLLLTLLRFVLYVTSFVFADEIFWVWMFGRNSCFFTTNLLRTPHVPWWVIIIINFYLMFHLGVHAIPTYAIATQLGSTYKRHLINDKVQSTLLRNLRAIRKQRRKQGRGGSFFSGGQPAGGTFARMSHASSYGDGTRATGL